MPSGYSAVSSWQQTLSRQRRRGTAATGRRYTLDADPTILPFEGCKRILQQGEVLLTKLYETKQQRH